ncbi:hypothetical protein CH380_20425 [Leptospira adleri]|uniref:Uncharacterized protein n=1 Tax=Leptospira adleri TaxID=2023186 RepID=A0A2M9YIL5_9LEPT|nr:hypothetical protein CH380_20425 [Leptospira adleri]PJZ60430.1 hypothetical protein CH376_18430 [Leptospira adleri]
MISFDRKNQSSFFGSACKNLVISDERKNRAGKKRKVACCKESGEDYDLFLRSFCGPFPICFLFYGKNPLTKL